ncbi:MAG TPA: N-6 DNA methylase [Chloroflexia bacterium]|nr:N-6 DNA methylase [Chloroflexia bacterium]
MPSRRKTTPDLQEQVNSWLTRLAARLPQNLDTAHPLVQLSPAKKYKHHAQNLASDATQTAGQLLLRLLAERVADLSLSSSSNEVVTVLTRLPSSIHEGELCKDIAAEINNLPEDLFKAWDLAGLQLWDSRNNRLKKRSGAFYTSPELACYIARRTLESRTSRERMVDPACGGGIFLLAALEQLYNQEAPMSVPELVLKRLYGLDLNPHAVVLARLALLRRLAELNDGPVSASLALVLAAQIRSGNALIGPVAALTKNSEKSVTREVFFKALEKKDLAEAFLRYNQWEKELALAQVEVASQVATLPIFNGPEDGLRLAALHPISWQATFPEVFEAGGFSAVLGNPPYVGFNDYSGVEKAYFAKTYAPVYNLKSDLYYYFIKRGLDLLAPGGKLGFVVSRFWKEAAFAAPLRRWLVSTNTLERIEDFGGEQHFEDASVDVCLLFARRRQATQEHHFPFVFEGREENLAQKSLSDGAPWTWLNRLPVERLLLAKIAEQSRPLGDFAECRTGVQTGLDKVFFLSGAQAQEYGVEPAVLRRAIKNADISPNRLNWRNLWLIYPSESFNPADYPALMAYLAPFREALERRLRYDEPFPYYELQWPRESDLFETPVKLVTPYKAPRNTFAVDRQQFFFSTDVISVVFPAEWQQEQMAANFLNSRLSTFQFRSFGKPVGGGQWDYYANPVKKLAFPRLALEKLEKKDDNLLLQLSRPDLEQTELDELVYELYGLTEAERTLLRKI